MDDIRVSILLTVVLSGCMPQDAVIPDGDVNVNSASVGMTFRRQEQSNWCWIAVSQMVAKSDMPQDEVASFYSNGADCSKLGTSSASGSAEDALPCNHTGDTTRALREVFGIFVIVTHVLSEGQLRYALARGKPVIINYVYDGGAHFAVVNGFDGDMYELFNSALEAPVWMTYEELLSNNEMTWKTSSAPE